MLNGSDAPWVSQTLPSLKNPSVLDIRFECVSFMAAKPTCRPMTIGLLYV